VRSHVLLGASLLAIASQAYSAGDTPPIPAPPIGESATEEVLVEGPEPRYVAPTLRDRIGRVWAPVYINGKGPFRLVLDTGANSSAVIGSLANRIGVPILESNSVQLHGVTGTSRVPTIRVDSLEVGDLLLNNQRLAIVQDVFGGAEGVLGGDGLSDKRIFIDFRNDEITIKRSRGAVVAAGYTRIPLKLRDGQLLMFDMMLGGVRTKALLDTGAQTTIGNNSLRNALTRRARQIREDAVIGVTLDVQQGQTVEAPPVNIGGIIVRGMRVTFGDIYIFSAWKMTDEPALLIGMDVIGRLDSLIIDYKRKELHLRARQ
jgi:predicted aspartyl protease